MSALGHYLEEEGIATVAVVLIRPQAEKTKPPRALWVPFELVTRDNLAGYLGRR